jgi:pyruvate/2-oxoglutarate dehydrogenase complex dihydrolipoamide acyltransferase (E2) component
MAEATPDAASLAAENNIDLESVQGTGQAGKILVGDVRKLIVPEEEDYGIPADREVPEEYEHMPAAWMRAYAYAANYSKNNRVKACVVFAEARWQDKEFQEPRG